MSELATSDTVVSARKRAEADPIDLRIVVDGPSMAGKTTTARSLGERLGRPVLSPSEHDGRTLLFDWMDHEGGRSDGRAIRTQVVAVPGHLPHLRARLLVTADVVLFVVDTTREHVGRSLVALGQVRELLAALPEPAPGLIVQANKRDLPGALPLAELRDLLALDPEQLLIESVATEGEGVRQSFVYAVRLGLAHVRASDGERTAERQLTADDLLAQLDLDPRPMDQRIAEEAAPLVTEPVALPSLGGDEPTAPTIHAPALGADGGHPKRLSPPPWRRRWLDRG